jgi:hypothetical protein
MAGQGWAGYAVLTVSNAGSKLLIFVPRAGHNHDLSLSFRRVEASLKGFPDAFMHRVTPCGPRGSLG